MEFKSKFFICLGTTASLVLCFLVGIISLVYYVDPLQIRNKEFFNTAIPSSSMRFDAQSVITNVSFDNAILGTSMLANTSAIEASQLLGGSFVNLSIDGANFYEREKVLSFLLQNKRVKSIIYSFGEFYFDSHEKSNDLSNWELLYDSNVLNDTVVLYDRRYIKTSLRYLLNPKIKKADMNYFDKPYAWDNNIEHTNRFGGLSKWVDSINQLQIKEFLTVTLPQTIAALEKEITPAYTESKIENSISYINKYLLNYVKSNPETDFHILLPPYFRYYYATWRQVDPSKYFLHMHAVRHIVEATKKYENLYVYGFENLDYLDNIENYKDIKHYNTDFNSYMLKAIAEGKHILTPSSVEPYLQECEVLAREYDIKEFYREVQKLIEEKK